MDRFWFRPLPAPRSWKAAEEKSQNLTIKPSTGTKLTTLVTTGSTAVTASTSGPYGSLGLDIALSSASSVLVNGLDRNDGLLLAVTVVACAGVAMSARVIVIEFALN